MEQIIITDKDKAFLRNEYPLLMYNESKNTISGVLAFNCTYNKIPIKEKYNIEFCLISKDESILPEVRETKGKIIKIAKRKKVEPTELHLNNTEGELCLIIPPKEKNRYPNGFDLKKFMRHIEEHLYWVSYYDRYDKPPWKGQAHGIKGYIEYLLE